MRSGTTSQWSTANQRPGAPEAGHHLVGDHEDPVPVADLAHALQVPVGRDEDAVRAGHRLEDEGRDGLRPLELDDLLEVRECLLARCPVPRAMPWYGSVTRMTPGMPGSAAQRRGSPVRLIAPAVAAVVAAVAGEDLVTPGEEARDLDRVLVRLRAAIREEEGVDVARRDLGQLRAQPRPRLGGHERVRVGERLCLLLDGGDHLRVAVADVRAHQLAVEVQEALPLRRPEVAALGPGDGDRVDLRLGAPFEEGVPLRESDHLVAAHRATLLGVDRHGNLVPLSLE